MEENLEEFNELRTSVGPKRVETPQVKAEAHNLLHLMRLRERLKKRRISLNSIGITIVTPKGDCSCIE